MKILLTGGNGRLDSELRALIPSIVAPASSELNITDLQNVLEVVECERPDVIVHAGGFQQASVTRNEFGFESLGRA